MFAAGGLIVGFLYDTLGWRWLNVGSAGIAGLALVYSILLPTPPLQKAKQKSEGLSAALCSAEFAGHAWTAFNMGWSMPSPKLVCMQASQSCNPNLVGRWACTPSSSCSR